MTMTQTLDAPGVVTLADDTLRVVFRRRYAKPIEKVWAAITTPERIADWLAEAEIEMRVGGAIRLNWNKGTNRMEGRVVALDPPNTFAWTWPLHGRDSVVRFDLEADGGGCWLTLTHSGVSTQSSGVRAGWHAHLEGIADAIEGRATSWATITDRKTAVEPLYPALPA